MRRATIRSAVEHPETVAAALGPDDTAEMDTRVEDGRVVTTMARETTGGLRSTADDYVVNLDVAQRTIEHAETYANRLAGRTDPDGRDGSTTSGTDRP